MTTPAPSRLACLAAILVSVHGASAQSAPAFDVASIRPVEVNTDSSIERSGGRITLRNTSLRDCIAFAYGIATGRDHELLGPGWLNEAHFSIEATTSPETSREDVRAMLRTLLAERFALRTHSESRTEAAYALTVAPQGLKMKPSNETDGAFVFGPGHLSARGISIAGLANRLSGPAFSLDRPVEDQTMTPGVFDFALDWAPAGAALDNTSPSLFTALTEQLGLQLKPQRMAVQVLIVDSISRQPTPN